MLLLIKLIVTSGDYVSGTVKPYILWVLYFAVFPLSISLLEFNFADFEFFHCYNALPKRSCGI